MWPDESARGIMTLMIPFVAIIELPLRPRWISIVHAFHVIENLGAETKPLKAVALVKQSLRPWRNCVEEMLSRMGQIELPDRVHENTFRLVSPSKVAIEVGMGETMLYTTCPQLLGDHEVFEQRWSHQPTERRGLNSVILIYGIKPFSAPCHPTTSSMIYPLQVRFSRRAGFRGAPSARSANVRMCET